ncbi:hypothetical protein [Virgibacillus doumboii]|nr:hypothetical protein [Virgibacillus doumboii]
MKEEDYCICNNGSGIYTDNEMFGYWEYCTACNKKIEDGFHYYDEPEL